MASCLRTPICTRGSARYGTCQQQAAQRVDASVLWEACVYGEGGQVGSHPEPRRTLVRNQSRNSSLNKACLVLVHMVTGIYAVIGYVYTLGHNLWKKRCYGMSADILENT